MSRLIYDGRVLSVGQFAGRHLGEPHRMVQVTLFPDAGQTHATLTLEEAREMFMAIVSELGDG